jgi:hypothetical protein
MFDMMGPQALQRLGNEVSRIVRVPTEAGQYIARFIFACTRGKQAIVTITAHMHACEGHGASFKSVSVYSKRRIYFTRAMRVAVARNLCPLCRDFRPDNILLQIRRLHAAMA